MTRGPGHGCAVLHCRAPQESESDLARPNCDADLMNAKVPVWYGLVIGSSHTTVIENPLMDTDNKLLPLKQQYLGAT